MFRRKDLWKNAATYSALRGGTYGIFLRELGEGTGELTLFYEGVSPDLRLQFELYVESHLRRRALPDTIRLRRILICPQCNLALADAAVQRRRETGRTWINCNVCEPPYRISIAEAEEQLEPSPKLAAMDRAADAQRDRETAASIIEGKRQANDFDVFLCHDGEDKPAVRKIANQLLERGILPWLDEWNISPFVPWQDELEKMIPRIKAVAVFVGPRTEKKRKWRDMEIRAFLQEFVERDIRLGMVLLPGATTEQLPVFLKSFHWIDFNQQDPDPLDQLVWGVTGERRPAYAM